MELDYKQIGYRIAQRRAELKIRQKDLAEKLDISNNHLSSIERGSQRASLEILVSICNELQMTPDYLLMGNMHSNNVPQNITDGLRLCTQEDIELLAEFTNILIKRRSKQWNGDNFV